MLSFGICLLKNNGEIVDELEVNIKEREECRQDPVTMDFWEKNKIAWEICHQNQISHYEAMEKLATFYSKWSEKFKLVWIAMPVCFDWMFLKSYYSAFTPPNSPDIGFKATCISTLRDYAIKLKIITNKQFFELTTNVQKETEHRSIDDARYQGLIFLSLINLIKSQKKKLE
jgi:hypothetical protein